MKNEERRASRLVRDAAPRPLETRDLATLGPTMLLLAMGVGFAVGLAVWGLLRLSGFLTELVWGGAAQACGWWFFPVVACTVGGLVIGLWSKFFHADPQPLEEVMASVKATGGYRVPNAPAGAVAFLLPLAFGGSVGPEAGLTGLIAAGCTWIGTTLKRAGVKAAEAVDAAVPAVLSVVFASPFAGLVYPMEEEGAARAARSGAESGTKDAAQGEPAKDETASAAASSPVAAPCGAAAQSETAAASADTRDAGAAGSASARAAQPAYDFSKSAKVTLYVASACGALAAAAVLSTVFGGGEGLPRFAAMQPSAAAYLWALPLIACGYVLSLVVRASTKASARLASSKPLANKTVLKPVLCGLVMGCVACALPNVLFSGEAETGRIMTEWVGVGAGVLLLTGAAKAVITPLCLNMGWNGGSFFPSIYAGVSFGYGAAVLLGLDPVLCAGLVTAAMMGSTMEKPLIALALLIMCFPMTGIVWLGVAAIVGSAIPVPKALK